MAGAPRNKTQAQLGIRIVRNKVALAALSVLVFCVSRGPFISSLWWARRGRLAIFISALLRGPCMHWSHGLTAFPERGPFLHPAPLYESMTRLGSLARLLGWKPKPDSDPHVVIRSLNSLFQLAFWLTFGFHQSVEGGTYSWDHAHGIFDSI